MNAPGGPFFLSGSLIVMALDFAEPFTERTPRVVNAAKLNRGAGRKKAGLFIVEGENSVEAAVATGEATDVFVTEIAANRFGEIVTTANYMDVFTHAITDKAAESLSDTVHTTGIFAVCKPVTWTLGAVLKGRPKLLAVCVGTNDPGNAGTIIRLVDALGGDAVIFAGDTVDPESPKVVRATAGSLFHVPVVRERDLNGALGQLRAAGLKLAATTMSGEIVLGQNIASDVLDQPTAWVFGNEAHGLPDEVMNAADYRISIPIKGSVESLNLSTAASICLWESTLHLEG